MRLEMRTRMHRESEVRERPGRPCEMSGPGPGSCDSPHHARAWGILSVHANRSGRSRYLERIMKE